jgi:hypothetical protein
VRPAASYFGAAERDGLLLLPGLVPRVLERVQRVQSRARAGAQRSGLCAPTDREDSSVSDRRLQRVRRVNAKRPRDLEVHVYPIPANDRTEAVLDYISLLLDEIGTVGKG